MGSKRLGLARTKALLEGLKREINLENTQLVNADVRGKKQELSGDGLQSGSIDTPKTIVTQRDGSIITTFQIDLENLSGSSAQANGPGGHQLVIGNYEAAADGISYAQMFQWNESINGKCYKIDLSCIEAPVGGAANATFVLSSSTLATYEQGDAPSGDPTAVCSFGTTPISASQTITVNELVSSPGNQEYMFLCTLSGNKGTGGKYTSGKLVLKFYSYPNF